MDKIEYVTNQLKKTFGKKYENYCITRIINLVNRFDLKFVTQQMFKKSDGEIALVDLYFPQINMWIEIDETHHKNNVIGDNERTKEIINMNNLIRKKLNNLEEVIYLEMEEPYRIIIHDNTLEEINLQIDIVVEEINQRISKLGDSFIPWNNIYESPLFYKEKGYIDCNENVKFKTMDMIGSLFNVKISFYNKVHGFFPISGNIYAWCPTLKLLGDECDKISCDNEMSDDGRYIYESRKQKNDIFVKEVLNKNQIRYIFAKYKDEVGNKSYKFKGVYKLDINKTLEINKRAWIKVESKIYLDK